jgi:hypothetical protein
MDQSEIKTLAALEAKVDGLNGTVHEMHRRVFNGMAKEILKEVDEKVEKIRETVDKRLDGVDKKLGSSQKLVIGVMIAILLALAGIVIESRVSNEKNYKAIIDIGTELSNHINAAVKPGVTK